MARLMRRCLLLSSLLLMAVVAEAGTFLLPLAGRQQYSVLIRARGVELTGVCIIKTDSVGDSRGAIVNEFGIHALDFTLSADRRRVRLQNVMPQMDRWYIRRVVRSDLRLLFGATAAGERKGRRTVTQDADGTLTLTNTRYNITYSLKKIDDSQR